MNEARTDRIRVLRHKHVQHQIKQALDTLFRDLAETPLSPIDPEVSLKLQRGLYSHLKKLRSSGTLRSERYSNAAQAVIALLEHISKLGGPVYSELYTGSGGSGFFLGPLPEAVLLSCMQQEYEGVALVQPDLVAGAVLDHATDDPLLGDFYEVEWWA